jgi:alpha-tubulin suppressor-like RCC1 family protein
MSFPISYRRAEVRPTKKHRRRWWSGLRLAISIALLSIVAACAQEKNTPAVKVAMGDNHGVWLKSDGTVWVWGGNRRGQLGIDGDHAYGPVEVPELNGIQDVTAGDSFTAAVGNDGSLWTWGDNEYGELGDGTNQGSPKPVRIASLTRVAAVSAGGRHMLALRADGTVWEWGERPSGLPSNVPRQVGNLAGVLAIAASERHSVALKSDGTVWVWGDHGAEVVGSGVSSVPMQVAGFADVTAVAAGYQLTVALKKDGTVWAVGYGVAGGLGNGSTESSTKPVMVTGLTGVKAVAAGYMHALALRGDGTVWSWGYNHEHQLGNLRVAAEQSAKPVRSGTLTGVVAIAAAASHSAAIGGDSIAWAWGQNDDGSLGVDSETLARSDVPMRVGQDVPGECSELFVCTTDIGKVIRICGVQDPADVAKWSEIQYRFGPESGPPELAFPEDPSSGPPALFFSHEEKNGDYRVTVRFTNGAYTYRVYSSTKTGAGVEVEDGKTKTRSGIACNERPEMFIEYMRLNLPCDLKNPHGAAACRENPYGGK